MEGFFVGNLLLAVLGYTEVPLSQCYALPAQHKARPAGALKGSLNKKASPLGVTPHGVGRCPQGRGDRSVRGEPAKLVEGFLVESFS